MKDQLTSLVKIARFTSILGHPLLTATIFTIFVSLHLFHLQKAVWVSCMLIGIIVLPVVLWNYYKTQKGEYTNFDVSVQHQRNSMYLIMIPLVIFATIIMFITHQPHSLCSGLVFASLLIIISYIVNFFIKASLHTSLSFFLSFSLMTIDLAWGIIMIGISILISTSRLILKRHSLSEVITGFIIGTLMGGGFYIFISGNYGG